jgi:hypothetical protein
MNRSDAVTALATECALRIVDGGRTATFTAPLNLAVSSQRTIRVVKVASLSSGSGSDSFPDLGLRPVRAVGG